MKLYRLLVLAFLMAFASFSNAQVNIKGLIGYWPLDSNANDLSKHGNHGKVTGATLTNDRHGNSNSAYYFDGNGDYIDFSNDISLFPDYITINYWIRHYEKSTQMALMNCSNSNGGEWGVGMAITTSVGLAIGAGAGSNDHVIGFHSNNNLADSQWHMITFVYSDKNKDKISVYLDGCFAGYNNWSGSRGGFNSSDKLQYDTSVHWYLGASAQYFASSTNNGTQYFKGAIDDIRMFDRGLSSQEIHSMYHDTIVFDTIKVTQYDTITTFDTTSVTIYDTTQVLDTTFVTVYDTTFINDTTHVSIFDTTFITHYDTLDIYDTSYVNIYDTIDIYDTSRIVIYDTTRIQIFDTFYVSVTDTLYIDLDRNSSNQTLTCSVKLYPNPTDDVLYIEGGSDCQSAGYSVKVVDAVGKLIYSSSIGIGVKSFSLDKFTTTGIYYVDIRDIRGQLVDRRKIMIY